MKKIYVTGIPCSGKTTLINKLAGKYPGISTISYSKILHDYIINEKKFPIEKSDLRRRSSAIIEPEDINIVDNIVIKQMRHISKTTNIILDSHPVTTEDYGFRVTQFKKEFVKQADFDLLVCLFASTKTIINRYHKDNSSRKIISDYEVEASMHIQHSIAISYGVLLDRPVYFYNTDNNIDFLVEELYSKIIAAT